MPELERRAVQLYRNRGRRDLRDRNRRRLGRVRTVAAGHLLARRVAGREGLRDGAVVVAVFDPKGRKRGEEGVAGLAQRHPVLRAPRAGEAWLDGVEIEIDDLAVIGLDALVVEEELGAAIALHARDVLFAPAGHAQVGKRLFVDREEPARRPVLRRHVRDRRAVGEREAREAATEELDELADDAELAKSLA